MAYQTDLVYRLEMPNKKNTKREKKSVAAFVALLVRFFCWWNGKSKQSCFFFSSTIFFFFVPFTPSVTSYFPLFCYLSSSPSFRRFFFGDRWLRKLNFFISLGDYTLVREMWRMGGKKEIYIFWRKPSSEEDPIKVNEIVEPRRVEKIVSIIFLSVFFERDVKCGKPIHSFSSLAFSSNFFNPLLNKCKVIKWADELEFVCFFIFLVSAFLT